MQHVEKNAAGMRETERDRETGETGETETQRRRDTETHTDTETQRLLSKLFTRNIHGGAFFENDIEL